jgi:hypothetical protein
MAAIDHVVSSICRRPCYHDDPRSRMISRRRSQLVWSTPLPHSVCAICHRRRRHQGSSARRIGYRTCTISSHRRALYYSIRAPWLDRAQSFHSRRSGRPWTLSARGRRRQTAHTTTWPISIESQDEENRSCHMEGRLNWVQLRPCTDRVEHGHDCVSVGKSVKEKEKACDSLH